MNPPAAPAFKEWNVIVEALGHGEQAIILRKGGISEKRGGFRVDADRFWLFPTRFHAQLEKTKTTAARWFTPEATAAADSKHVTVPESGSARADQITLRYFADAVGHRFLDNEADIAALDSLHYWNDDAVREKSAWSQPAGLHVILVRVYRLATPIVLATTPAMGGCKSWIELPVDFPANATPVLGEEAFAAIRHRAGF